MNELVPRPTHGANDPVPGTEACGCCAGSELSSPRAHQNRHGLTAVRYRIGQHADFRASLLAGLSESEFAPLALLLTRDADDFTIGLIDAFACAADVLTFYQERIANECWLRTATERTSLQELARLIGYRLRPGVAAETSLAFALESPRTPPTNAPKEPGAFVTGIPSKVTLTTGLKVQSVPGQDEKPQTFETVETVEARPEWSVMVPWLALPRIPVKGDRHTWLQGVNTGLKVGDALLLVGAEFGRDPGDDRWDFRVLSEVVSYPDQDRTRVAWRRGLGSIDPPKGPSTEQPRGFALRQRAGVYGHNAPMWKAMPVDYRTDYVRHTSHAADAQDWPEFSISKAGTGYVDLDSSYPAIGPGGFAVLARGAYDHPGGSAPAGTYVELFTILGVSDVSREDFAISGKCTRLQLGGENHALFQGYVRATRVFAASDELKFTDHPVTTDVAGADIPVAVPPAGLDPGRRVIVQGITTAGAAVTHPAVVVRVRAEGVHAVLEIDPPLAAPLRRQSVRVFGNVVLARHGETVTQVLGSGDAGKPHQRFELKHLPLTWRGAANELGASSELKVRVGGVSWHDVPRLFGTGPGDRVFTVQTDAAGREWIAFGDGHRGARLPSGSNNLHATYRKGIGQMGNVRAETLTQLMTRPLGVKSVANPAAALGGTDPEPAEHARESMPLGTRTLGRVVSLLDYEDFARAYSGIDQAQATVLQLPHGPVIAVTVAGQDGAPIPVTSPVWTNLRDALLASGDPHVQVRLLGHQASTFRVGLKVKCHPDHDRDTVLARVEATLRAAFSFARRRLSQPVHQSEVIAVVHSVPGVVAVDLDVLHGGTAPLAQTVRSRQTRLLASRMRVAGGAPLPSEILTLHPGPLDHLEVMP